MAPTPPPWAPSHLCLQRLLHQLLQPAVRGEEGRWQLRLQCCQHLTPAACAATQPAAAAAAVITRRAQQQACGVGNSGQS